MEGAELNSIRYELQYACDLVKEKSREIKALRERVADLEILYESWRSRAHIQRDNVLKLQEVNDNWEKYFEKIAGKVTALYHVLASECLPRGQDTGISVERPGVTPAVQALTPAECRQVAGVASGAESERVRVEEPRAVQGVTQCVDVAEASEAASESIGDRGRYASRTGPRVWGIRVVRTAG